MSIKNFKIHFTVEEYMKEALNPRPFCFEDYTINRIYRDEKVNE